MDAESSVQKYSPKGTLAMLLVLSSVLLLQIVCFNVIVCFSNPFHSMMQKILQLGESECDTKFKGKLNSIKRF